MKKFLIQASIWLFKVYVLDRAHDDFVADVLRANGFNVQKPSTANLGREPDGKTVLPPLDPPPPREVSRHWEEIPYWRQDR